MPAASVRIAPSLLSADFGRLAEDLAMLEAAAADSGRRIVVRALTGQPLDHPEVLTIPETGYLKGALLEAGD